MKIPRITKAQIQHTISNHFEDPWKVDEWEHQFGNNGDLQARLLTLEATFPREWRARMIAEGHWHPLVTDLTGSAGRPKLLALADELTSFPNLKSGQATLPMAGKLRDSRQYGPIMSEFLAARFLRRLGVTRPQPQPGRLGCDYLVNGRALTMGAEVKSLRQSLRSDAADRAFMIAHSGKSGISGPPRDEAYEARRLYGRMRHAAKQLAATKMKRPAKDCARIVLLDLDGDSFLTNLGERIHRWMDLDWAAPIDMVMFIDHALLPGAGGTVAGPSFRRSDRLFQALVDEFGPLCQGRHFHVDSTQGYAACKYPWI